MAKNKAPKKQKRPTRTTKKVQNEKHGAEFLWNDRRKEIQNIISRLLWSSNQPTAMTQSIPGCNHGWGMTLQDQLDFRALTLWAKRPLSIHDAMKVLSLMIDGSLGQIEEFEETYENLLRHTKRERELSWKFVFPMHIKFNSDVILPVNFRLFGLTFKLNLWESSITGMGKKRIQIAIQNIPPKNKGVEIHKYSLEIVARGNDSSQAWREIEPAFDAFRGMMELTTGYGSQFLSSPPRARRKFPHPLWMIIWNRQNKTVESSYFLVDEADRRPEKAFSLNKEEVNQFKKNVETCIGNPKDEEDIHTLIADVLRIYVQAMDSRSEHLCFLGLWQCAEAITLAGKHRGSGKVVYNRMCRILANSKLNINGLTIILKEFYNKRNKLVHRGIHSSINAEETNLLKTCFEMCLIWLIEKCKDLPTKTHLDYFYEFETKDELKLKKMKDSISTLQRHRKKK